MLAADMDIKDVPAKLKSMGRSQAWLARELGIDASSMSKTFKGERRLQAQELIRIEQLLGERMDVADVAQDAGRRDAAAQARIPVFGYAAAAGSDRIALTEGHVVDWVEAPALWNGQGEIYIVRIIGDRMEPRFFGGEPVIVHRNLPPGRGQDMLVEFKDGSGLVRNYRGQRDGMIWALQYNPPEGEAQELSFPVDSVKALHAIHLPTRLLSL
jgi:phage repressor protein C with HTH and peptisase S24 domain